MNKTRANLKEKDRMSTVVDGPELFRRLSGTLQTAKSADFAVAFWGRGAAESLGIQEDTSTKIRIVCNLLSGGTNPNEIRTLLERGVEVKQLNDLHAKIGVIGDMSFVGSSNMSTNGLGMKEGGAGWREANVLYGEARSEIVDRFEAFWEAAGSIDDDHLRSAEVAWKARLRGAAEAAQSQGSRSLLDVMRSAPAHLDGLNVRVVAYERETDPEERASLDEAEERARTEYGETFSMYWAWDSLTRLTKPAYLLSYYWDGAGPLTYEALYRRDMDNFPDLEDDETINVVHKVRNIAGITCGEEDERTIRAAFERYANDKPGEKRDERSYNIPISALASYL